MADNNNENQNVTAKDLLSRLSSHRSEREKNGEASSSQTDPVFEITKKNDSTESEASFEFGGIGGDMDSSDEVREPDSAETAEAYEISDEYSMGNSAEDEIFSDAEQDVQNGYEPVADDEIYPEGDWDISDDVDEYGEYVQEEYNGADAYDDGFTVGEEQPYMYEDKIVGEGTDFPDGADYDNILPEDDFFDNDPIESYDEYSDEANEEDTTPKEYSEEEDFENLVAEVNAQSGINGDDFDETDISLMVALGMEDELAKSMGEEAATQIDDFVADQEEWMDKTNRFGAGEYSDPSENAQIAEKYRERNRRAFIKVILTLAIAVVLLVYENLPVIGFQLSGVLDPAIYPVVYLMIDLQLVMFAAALCINHVGRGLADLFKFKPSVDTVPALLGIASVVATTAAAYTSVPGIEPVPFNFPVALSFLMVAINEYLTVRREIFSFNIVSSKKPKFVMRRLSTRDSVLESEAVADIDSAIVDEGDIIKIQKTDFVDGYFWRTKQSGSANRSYVALAIVFSVALAVLASIYAAVSKNGSAVNVGYATLSCAMPVSMLIIGCYPFYRANRRAYENDSTIIGEGSVEEYSGIGVISFDDVNVFPSYSVKVRNVRLFNNCRIDKVLYYAASVFSATGGPLADVFEVATMETGHSENVQILETGMGYIEACVNGRSVMFGSADALSSLGIIIPEEVATKTADIPSDCTVMYMIYQRKLVAKMVVNYVLDPDFEYILRQLTGSGMCVCVKTFDPNIDEDMIYRQIKTGRYSLRVIKYKNTEEITKYSRRAEGGIVSRNTTKSLLHTVSSCDKILSAQKTGYIIGVLSSILGAAIMGIILIAGAFDSMHSIYVALCQLFWLIPAVITTKLIVR